MGDEPPPRPVVARLSVENRRRSAPRITVTLEDGRTAQFSPDLVVRERIRQAMVLNGEEHWQQLVAAQARLDARQRLIQYLSTRRKSRREAEAYLERLAFPEDAVIYAIDSAHELGYLDDAAYAGAFVRTKDKTGKEGPRSIAAGLGKRGVARDLIDEAVSPLEPAEVQRPKALALATKRWVNLQSDLSRQSGQQGQPGPSYQPETADQPNQSESPDPPPPQPRKSRWQRPAKQSPTFRISSAETDARNKLCNLLLRRGFSPDVVFSVVREVTGETMDRPPDPE